MTDPDEAALAKLAKKMLATPPKHHEDMKVGGRKAKPPVQKGTTKQPKSGKPK